MILFYILFLLPLHAYCGYERWPSYRSSVMEGDKPILRVGGAEPEVKEIEENTPDDVRNDFKLLKENRNPELVRDFSLLISWLIDNYGYKIAQSRRQEYREEMLEGHHFKNIKFDAQSNKRRSNRKDNSRRQLRFLLDDIAAKNNYLETNNMNRENDEEEAEEVYENVQERAVTGNSPVQRSKLDADTPNPNWKNELKDFMMDLITRFPRTRIDRYARPVIRAIEKNNKVSVVDVDVNKFGTIFIDYVDMNVPKAKVIIDEGRTYKPSDSSFVDLTAKRKRKKKENKHGKHRKHKHSKTNHEKYTFDEWKPLS